MSSVGILAEILPAYAPLVAVVPEADMVAGPLPLNAAFPALSLMVVSVRDMPVLKPRGWRRRDARVQVTAFARNYEQVQEIIRLVRAAAADRYGDFAGMTSVSILADLTGPDMMDEQASLLMQTQDFKVGFNEPLA